VYLADTSVFARLSKTPVAAAFGPLAAAGAVALCAPVVFELGFAAQSGKDHEDLMERLLAFASVPTSEADHRRALDLQAALARGLTILHYDADFELIAGITGQAQQWIVERGTAD